MCVCVHECVCLCLLAYACVCFGAHAFVYVLFVLVTNQSKQYLNSANVAAKHFRFQAYDVASEDDIMEDRKSDASEDA